MTVTRTDDSVTHTDDSVSHTEPPFPESDTMKVAVVVLLLAATAVARPQVGHLGGFASGSGGGVLNQGQSHGPFGRTGVQQVAAHATVSDAEFQMRMLVDLLKNSQLLHVLSPLVFSHYLPNSKHTKK